MAYSNTYTLRQLLGGNLTLEIPDMQRDYCWGDRLQNQLQPAGKVTLFISGLKQMYIADRPTTLGLLYGYEYPPKSNHILIIDGQQRLTTLYLLIGMLYRRTPTTELRRLLISDYKLIDDRAPRLLYQVRSEALYFMSDLVTNFFLDRNGRLSQLKNSSWYYTNYDSDPTIQNFIGALQQIDDVLEKASESPDWDFDKFAHFIADKVTLTYYDLGAREQAEQMFITINTTGEPLTEAQNLKSMLAAMSDDSSETMAKWEQIEHWAWKNRDKTDPTRPGTSDQMMSKILQLWHYLLSKKNDYKDIKQRFNVLYRQFKCYRRLTDAVPEAIKQDTATPGGIFSIVPIMIYIRKWQYADNYSRTANHNIAALWKFITNITRYQKVTSSGSDTEAAIKAIDLMTSPEIVSLLTVEGVSDRILDADNIVKLKLIAQYYDDRTLVEGIIDRGEAHPMINGRLRRIIDWCTDRTGHTDLALMNEYIDTIYEIWGTDISCNAKLDTLRRALLAQRHPGFPIIRRGETCLSLCWNYYDWQRLMQTSPGLIRQTLDRVRQSERPAIETLRSIISKFSDKNYPYYFLIKREDIIGVCDKRTLLRPSMPFIGFYVEGEANPIMNWYVEQHQLIIDSNDWTTIRAYGTRCLYTDNRRCDMTIDLYHTNDTDYPYKMEIFSREGIAPVDIAVMLNEIGYRSRYDKKRGRHFINLPDAHTAVSLIQTVSKTITALTR